MVQNRVVNFINNHKKGIAIVGATVAGGLALIALGKCTRIVSVAGATKSLKSNDINVDGWDLGKLSMCWEEGDYINAIVEDLTLADAGKLGENLLKINGMTPDTGLSVVVGMPNNREK